MTDYAGNDSFPEAVELPDAGDKRSTLSVAAPLEGALDRTRYLQNKKALKLGAAGGKSMLNITSASATPVAVDPAAVNFILVNNALTENKTLELDAGNDGDEIFYLRRGITHSFAVILTDAAGTIAQDDNANTNQTWARLRYFAEIVGVVDAGWYVIEHGLVLGDWIDIRDVAWTV